MLLCAHPSMKRPPSHQTETATIIQSKRRLLTTRAFSFTAGRETPTLSILLATVHSPFLDVFISHTYFSDNNPFAFDLCTLSVKTKEHFNTALTTYMKQYVPMLHAERYSLINAPFLAASFSCILLLCEYSVNIARREQCYVRLDLSFC